MLTVATGLFLQALNRQWRGWRLYLAGVGVAYPLGWVALSAEQVSIFIVFWLAVACYLGWSMAAQPAGLWREVLLGLALALVLTKPQDGLLPAALLILWFGHQRHWATLAAFIGWLAALLALSSLALPRWWETVDLPALLANLNGQVQASGQVAARVNATFFHWAAPWGLAGPAVFILYFLLLLGCLAWLYAAIRSSQAASCRSPIGLISIATVSGFLLTPYAFEYDYIVMLPALLQVFQGLRHSGVWRRSLSAALLVPFYSIHLWGRWMSDAYWLPIFLTCLLLLQGGWVQHESDLTKGA